MSEWETKAAIREVLNGYSGAAGRLNIDEFVNFFLPDAEIYGIASLFGQPEPLQGHAQIRALFGRSFENLEWLVQMNNNTDLSLSNDGKKAVASSGLVEMAKPKNADMIVLIARYDDELTLTPQGWRFAKRTLTRHRFSKVP